MTSSESVLTRAWVEIDLGALERNAVVIAARAGVPILPMIKADAYGLGAVAAARALEAIEPWGYGVATVDEGAELRAAGIKRRIVVFTPLMNGDLPGAYRERLTPALSHPASIAAWRELGDLPWHLAVDTGMSRAGLRWDSVHTLRDLLRASPPEGAFTHFHSADIDASSIDVQERRFREAIAALPVRPVVLHAENGAAVERRGHSPWDLVRPGIFLYGVSSLGVVTPDPVFAVRARVVDIRAVREGETVSYLGSYRAVGNRRIATLAIGYADGLRRALSNRGSALVRGREVPIAGMVTMDMTMVDVTDVPCEIGDIATLIGQDGDARIDAAAVAHLVELSPYELLTGLRGRLERLYHKGGA
jgi:alanine racemase